MAYTKSTKDTSPVSCEFVKNGASWGYSYLAGEKGVVRKGDVEILVKNRVIINPKPVTEVATAKGATEKATA
jgi:hypothetical protein